MTRRVGFRVVGKWPTAVFLLVLPFSASGCIWLAVPSLAYSGYKYEQKHNSQQVSSQSTHKSRSKRRRARRRSTQSATARKQVDAEMWRG